MSISPTKQRNIGLDLLRISLALLIYMFHANMHFDCHFGIFDHVARLGAIAMTGFFMLSGYALNMSNKEVLTDMSSMKRFYVKRFASIAPLYYFVAIVFIVLFTNETWKEQILLFPIEVLGLQSVFSSLFSVSHNGGTWFISCLVICYILFPFIQGVCNRLKKKELLILGGACFILLLLSPLIQRHFQCAKIYDNPFFRLLEFIIGVLLNIAVVRIQKKNKRNLPNWIVWAILILLIVFMCTGLTMADKAMGNQPRDFMLMNWIVLPAFIGVFFCLGHLNIAMERGPKLIVYCSSLAFAFFLSQFFVWGPAHLTVTRLLGVDNNVIRIAVSFMLCVCISILLHECIEKPVKNLLLNKLL